MPMPSPTSSPVAVTQCEEEAGVAEGHWLVVGSVVGLLAVVEEGVAVAEMSASAAMLYPSTKAVPFWIRAERMILKRLTSGSWQQLVEFAPSEQHQLLVEHRYSVLGVPSCDGTQCGKQ